MKELKEYIGKKVFLILKGKLYYTGTVLNVDANMMNIKDKFDNYVTFALSEILKIEEVRE